MILAEEGPWIAIAEGDLISYVTIDSFTSALKKASHQ